MKRNDCMAGIIVSGILSVLLILGLFAGYSFLLWRGPAVLARVLEVAVAAGAILYLDNSGIRQSLVRNLPRSFPFYKKLTINRHTDDQATDLFLTITLVCLLIAWATPHLRFLFIGLAILFPLLGVYRYLRYNDFIHLSSNSPDRISPTAAILLAPSLLFAIWGLRNHNYNTFFWVLLAAASLTMTALFFRYSREYRVKKSVAAGFIFLVTTFSFGALCMINENFDFGEPTLYEVEVVDKYIEGGRAQTPMVVVSPWDGQTDTVDIAINPEEYRSVEVGGKATVIQHDGVLGMNWYYLDVEDGDMP